MITATSASHLLRVDFLPTQVLGLPGRLGMTFAPGKKDRGREVIWNRDLDQDLDRLRHVFCADGLVSLVQDHELANLGIAELVNRAQAHGLWVVRFGIPDRSIPQDKDAFGTLVQATLEKLRRGENVVVHCRGGLGRAGMLVSCCLVVLGHTPQYAIAQARAARPGAVETGQQEQFVAQFARERASVLHRILPPSPAPAIPLERVRATLLGGALGDALGYPIEFENSSTRLLEQYGRAAPSTLAFAGPVHFSDDTQMTLFTAWGLVRGLTNARHGAAPDLVRSVQHALLQWYETQIGTGVKKHCGWLFAVEGLHVPRAPGMTCMSALREQAAGGRMPTIDQVSNNSKGCGAVMRAAPCGLGAASRPQAFFLARDTGALTHGHPSGYLSGAYLAALIWDLVRGADWFTAMQNANALLQQESDHEELFRCIQAARQTAANTRCDAASLERLGGGWVGEQALAIALACCLQTPCGDPSAVAETLWRSVAHGGDSDSTGSIAGNLLGARFGLSALPSGWLSELEMADVIERMASDLHAAAHLGTTFDLVAYPNCEGS